jgi:hypothetical protein
MNKVLIVDTSILCVWLKVPGKDSCGPKNDLWNWERVESYIQNEIKKESILVMPLAAIIETGNHISQAEGDRYTVAVKFADLIISAADQLTPWAAFTAQSALWDKDGLKRLAKEWPELAKSRLSIGDATIKHVAELYALTGCEVEILTGDQGLKSYEPERQPITPRRRK